jgi:hypothetical protein
MKSVLRFFILVSALTICFAYGPFRANDVKLSHAQGFELVVSSTIPIPAEVFASVVETLRQRPTNILPGNRLIITSLDQSSGWALMTVAVEPSTTYESILAVSGVVIAKFGLSGWNSAILGTDVYETLLNEAPATLLPADAKPFVSARATSSALAPESIGTSLKWPWSSNATWTMTQGPHSWWGAGNGTDFSAIDFRSLGTDKGVHAAAGGTIVRRCDDNYQHEVVIRHSTGTSTDEVTGYLHLDNNGQYASALPLGTLVNGGDYIGSYYDGAIPKGSKCGYGTGGHLHFWIGTIPSNDSVTWPNFGYANMYGQTISDWQMQSGNCLHKGSERPLCPGMPIPGDGSAPGPRSPSNLNANAVSSSQLDISWSGSPDSVEGYRIYSGNAMVAQVTNTSYSVSGLSSCSTYSFYVKAYNGDLESGASNTASAKTSGCSSGAPSAPSLSSPSNGQVFGRYDDITLTWNSNGSYSYLIEFWGGPDNGRSNLPWQSGTSLYFGNGNWGGNYSWHVKAQNSSGQVSDWGETWSFAKKFGTPNNVSVAPTSDSQTHLTWDPSADAPGNVEGYKIYRDGQLRSVEGSGTPSFDDYDLNCNSSYSYYLKAYKGDGESDVSSTVWVTTSSCPPPAPSASFDSWPQSGPAPLAVAMHIVDTSNITSCSWDYGDGQTGTSCDLSHNHTYSNPGTYTVRLDVIGPGGSDSKTISDYITVTGPQAPSAPALLRPDANATLPEGTDVVLEWSSVGGATQYAVEWQREGESFQNSGKISAISYHVA